MAGSGGVDRRGGSGRGTEGVPPAAAPVASGGPVGRILLPNVKDTKLLGRNEVTAFALPCGAVILFDGNGRVHGARGASGDPRVACPLTTQAEIQSDVRSLRERLEALSGAVCSVVAVLRSIRTAGGCSDASCDQLDDATSRLLGVLREEDRDRGATRTPIRLGEDRPDPALRSCGADVRPEVRPEGPLPIDGEPESGGPGEGPPALP